MMKSNEENYKTITEVNDLSKDTKDMEETERPDYEEIIYMAKLVGKELGTRFSGTLEDTFEDELIKTKSTSGLGLFSRVTIEYLYKGEWIPVFEYNGILQGLVRYRYGKWVDLLTTLYKKACQRIEEREAEFFGDLDEE